MPQFLVNQIFFPGLHKKKRKKKKRAGYRANPIACGWAGAIFEVTRAFLQNKCQSEGKDRKKKS